MNDSVRAARIARLTAAAGVRSADAEARARRAITRLQNNGQPITFTAIAVAAGVSTSFLYQHHELRKEIVARRGSGAISGSRARTASPALIESLRTKLATAIDRNRQLAEQVAQLNTENQVLRSRLLDTRAQPPKSTGDVSADPHN